MDFLLQILLMSDDGDLFYYNAEADGGIAFDDPDLAIDWPIDPSRAIMSEKDHRHPTLKEFEAENPFVVH